MEEVDSAARELEPWRRDPSTPLVVEARARPRPSANRPRSPRSPAGSAGLGRRGRGGVLPRVLTRQPWRGAQIYLQAWATGDGAAEGRMPAAAGDALDAGGSPSGAHAARLPARGAARRRGRPAARLELCECRGGAAGRTLLERWTLTYAPAAAGESRPPAGRPATSRLEPAGIYKRLVIALRSLYSYVRVLPAYRLLRACKVRAPRRAACSAGGRGRPPRRLTSLAGRR